MRAIRLRINASIAQSGPPTANQTPAPDDITQRCRAVEAAATTTAIVASPR